MDIKSKKNGLEKYLSILHIDKTEFEQVLKNTKEKLTETNRDIAETKQLIHGLEQRLRELSKQDSNISIDNFDLIRNNINKLVESEYQLKLLEKELNETYQTQLTEFHKKQRYIDACKEKYDGYDAEIKQTINKKDSLELDDLVGQRKWVLENDV